MFRIIPNSLDIAINAKLDAELAKHPDAEKDREVLRDQLIDFFDEHGYVPDFSLQKKEAKDNEANSERG